MNQERTGSRTLLLGSGTFAEQLAAVINSQPQCGYELVGVVSAQAPTTGWCQGVPILGTADDLAGIIARTGAERIVVTLPARSDLLPDHQLIEARISNEVIIENGEEVYEH